MLRLQFSFVSKAKRNWWPPSINGNLNRTFFFNLAVRTNATINKEDSFENVNSCGPETKRQNER